jgi:hypothetical protein
MPSNRTTRKPRGQAARPVPEADSADTGATVPTSAPDGTTAASPQGPSDTTATRALSAALAAHPGATVAELATAAKIGHSTAFKALIALEKAGLASRHLGGIDGPRLRPDRWQMGPLTATVAKAGEPVAVDVEAAEAVGSAGKDTRDQKPKRAPAGSQPVTTITARPDPSDAPAAVGGKTRLRGGRLREMVLDHLRSHPGEELTPFVIGRELGRSSGAVANACDRLLADGAIGETSQKPRRFRFTG